MGRESSDRSHFNSRLLSKQIQVCCVLVGQNGWAWPPTYPPKWLNQPLDGETKQRLSLSGSATCVSWQTKFYKQLSFCLWMDGWIDWLMAPKAVWVKDALRLDSLSLIAESLIDEMKAAIRTIWKRANSQSWSISFYSGFARSSLHMKSALWKRCKQHH